ncbi:transcriptional regulator [Halonotius sp. F2-221B]|uniref:HVO_A0114 family putative DNA-binding protein n=1 Tax=Halonotius sp. F2-221B TaxID=2731620 RepID=UPI00398B81DE
MTETNPTELAANGAESYPETLRITVGSVASMVDAAVAQLDGDGPAEEAVRAFDSVADIRQLLTDRRLEVMRSIMTAPPDSISDLADRLGRNYSDVHGDVEVLADHDIVYFDTDGRAKRPVIPYERVRVDIEVVGDASSEHAAIS